MIKNFKLGVFGVVADSLNFRRAAEEFHLTQPAITSHVKTLEENLGIALFDRLGRDVCLNLAGTTQLECARQIEAISNEAVAAAPFGMQEAVELSIGASHNTAVYRLLKLLSELLQEPPTLCIRTATLPSPFTGRWLRCQ